MSLRKKFANSLYLPFFIGGGLLAGGLTGHQLNQNDWDLERSNNADQMVEKFSSSFEKMSSLKDQNQMLEEQFSNILLDLSDGEMDEIKAQYAFNDTLLKKQGLQFAGQILSSDHINERDFEALATEFNTLGLSEYASVSIDPDNANALKECNANLSPISDERDYKKVSSCMEDKNDIDVIVVLFVIGLFGGGMSGAIFEDSRIRRRWKNISDKPKSKENKSGKSLSTRLKNRLGLHPKRPQN